MYINKIFVSYGNLIKKLNILVPLRYLKENGSFKSMECLIISNFLEEKVMEVKKNSRVNM